MTPAETLIDILLAFAAAGVTTYLLRAAIHRRFGASESASPEHRAAVHGRAMGLVRTITLLAFGAAALVSVSLVLEQFGVRGPVGRPGEIANWLINSGVRILFIVVGALVAIRAAHLAIEHLQLTLGSRRDRSDLEWQRRATTLAGILSRLVTVSVAFVAILMLLAQLDLNVIPLLASAGVAGLAVGFGAQNLVRDVISGFFLILEDQVRVGDTARINGIAGAVEQVYMRTIVLRDAEGAVHVFQNGTIASLANLSKHFAFAVVTFRVSCRTDIDRVLATLREVGGEMHGDPLWETHLLEPLDVTGVEALDGRFANIQVRFKTLPLKQAQVANELRRRIMVAFAERKTVPLDSNIYHFVSHWRVKGTCGEVADVIGNPTELARWWPSVYLEVEELEPPDGRGLGRRVRLLTQGWLPYTLTWEFVVTASNYPHGFAIAATGDFEGTGVWTFQQDGDHVNITYDWEVAAEKPLLRNLSALLKPVFAANHRWAMAQGEASLKLELARRRAAPSDRVKIPAPPGPVTYAGVALVAGAVAVGATLTYLVLKARRRRDDAHG